MLGCRVAHFRKTSVEKARFFFLVHLGVIRIVYGFGNFRIKFSEQQNLLI